MDRQTLTGGPEVDDEDVPMEDEPLDPPDDGSQGSSESDFPDQSSTRSISSQPLTNLIEENGRLYANSTIYTPNPSDDTEHTRLQIKHQVFLHLLQGHPTLASLSATSLHRVLDIGTGNGEWPVQMGLAYPAAQIIATDISPFQPTRVPANVEFQLHDAADVPWTFAAPFDLIHMRSLKGLFADWRPIYAQCFAHLRDGGTLELVDAGQVQLGPGPGGAAPTAEDYSATATYNRARRAAAEKAGITVGTEHLDPRLLEGVGFRILREKTMDVPLGVWPEGARERQLGKMALVGVLEALEGIAMRLLTKELGWEAGEVRELCQAVVRELTSEGARATLPVRFVVARKFGGGE